MKTEKTERGFRRIVHPPYVDGDERLLQESSAIIGDEMDAFENPGSSALWVGKDHHLNREEVAILIDILQYWLVNKRLPEVEEVEA